VPEPRTFTCPVCGYSGLTAAPYANLQELPVPTHAVPPYEDVLGMPSYEVCPCCEFEFGNDDNPGTAIGVSFEQYRAEWLSNGANWWSKKPGPPPGWDALAQLRTAGLSDTPSPK